MKLVPCSKRPQYALHVALSQLPSARLVADTLQIRPRPLQVCFSSLLSCFSDLRSQVANCTVCMLLRRLICEVERQIPSAVPKRPLRLSNAWSYSPLNLQRRWTSRITPNTPPIDFTSNYATTHNKLIALADRTPTDLSLKDAMKFRRYVFAGAQEDGVREGIIVALKSMCKAGEVRLIELLLSLAEEDLGLVIDAGLHSVILQGLLDSRYFLQSLSWMQDMPRKPGAVVPNIDRWNDFLVLTIARRQRMIFWGAVNHIHDAKDVTPNEQTYMLIFQTLFQGKSVPLTSVRKWLVRMEDDGIRFSHEIFDVIVSGYTSREAYGMVAMVERMYEAGRGSSTTTEDRAKGFSDTLPGPEKQQRKKRDQGTARAPREENYKALLIETLLAEGDRAAANLCRTFRHRGFKPTSATLDDIAKCLSNVGSLVLWEKALSVEAGHTAWAAVIQNAAEGPTLRPAIQAYENFVQLGHTPTAAVLHPILRAYCSGRLRPPTDSDLSAALKLYEDYIRIVREREEAGMSPLAQDDAPIYNTLLRAIASSESISLYPAAASLMEDMQARGIAMDPMTTASSIILFMRLAPSADEALSAYKVLRLRPDGGYALDQEGFCAVLAAFCKTALTEPNAYAYYAEITRDMRSANCPVSAEVYTVLLQQLANLATKAGQDVNKRQTIADIIRRVHNSITVEASLTPDIFLWNQLMDAYQRAGCFGDALSVWESLWIYRQFNNASVSIILDTCSFAGAHDHAAMIFSKLRTAGFPLNQRNWDGWVECLCRLNRLDEATKVFCTVMPLEEGIKPTPEVARLLLRFARNYSRDEIREHVKHSLPDVYAQLYPARKRSLEA